MNLIHGSRFYRYRSLSSEEKGLQKGGKATKQSVGPVEALPTLWEGKFPCSDRDWGEESGTRGRSQGFEGEESGTRGEESGIEGRSQGLVWGSPLPSNAQTLCSCSSVTRTYIKNIKCQHRCLNC